MTADPLPTRAVLWHEDRPDFPPEAPPESVDVAVIGAGIAGVSTGLHLARAGLSTAILERRFPAFGASGRNAGHVLAGTSEYYNRAVLGLGREKAREIWAFTVENGRELAEEVASLPADVGWRQCGYLACAASDPERRELEASVQLLQEDGFSSEYWTADQLTKRYGLSPFLGARHSPDDAEVHPARLVWALLERYRAAGGRLALPCDVLGVEETGDGLRIELADGRRVRAGAVVWCLNAWSGERLPAFAERIQAVRGQMIATERLHKVMPMAMAANFGYEYWRQAERGEVVLGGWRWSQREQEIGTTSEELNPDIHAGLVDFLRRSFPRVEGVGLRMAWTGPMGFSQDGLPYVGEVPGKQGQFIAAGFTGHGFGLAWRCTRLLVRELTEGRLQPELRWFRARR